MIPVINSKYFCIANCVEPDLAGLISAKLNEPNKYFLLFEFPSVGKEYSYEYEFDEYTMSRHRAENLSIRLSNYVKIFDKPEYLILAGLTDEQKSYLYFKDDYNVIEVDSESDVEFLIRPLNELKSITLKVERKDLPNAIAVATNTNYSIEITDSDVEFVKWKPAGRGLVIIENVDLVSKVLSVNYAVSIGADYQLVSPFTDFEIRELKNLIIEWMDDKDNPLDAKFTEISAFIYPRISEIDFNQYEYVTFCTKGVPYTLITNNIIPSTYISIDDKPDFFITNNLLSTDEFLINSTVVFSPEEFKREETGFVIDYFEKSNYLVKKLIGHDATVSNIDMVTRFFPYELFHICSHGGEVNGYRLEKEFSDERGVIHKIEYDEVLSFIPSKFNKEVKIEAQQIWRYFNGDLWRSKSMQEKNYEHDVFTSMVKAVQAGSKDKYEGVPTGIVPISQHIKCRTFNYLAIFNTICDSKFYPIIFNNTCYSAQNIQASFLRSGARGYIGTLWNVNNSTAVRFAESLYKKASDSNLLSAFKECCDELAASIDKNIYVFYGLPFTNIRKPKTSTKLMVANELLHTHYRWKEISETTKNKELAKESKHISDWSYGELSDNFQKEVVHIINEKKKNAANN